MIIDEHPCIGTSRHFVNHEVCTADETACSLETEPDSLLRAYECSFKHPSIASSCVALREELLPYYYKTKATFALHARAGVRVSLIGRWLRAIDPRYLQHISNITIKAQIQHSRSDIALALMRQQLDTGGSDHLKSGVPYRKYVEAAVEFESTCPATHFYTYLVRCTLCVHFDIISECSIPHPLPRARRSGLEYYEQTIAFRQEGG
jgi:hypothetical protein